MPNCPYCDGNKKICNLVFSDIDFKRICKENCSDCEYDVDCKYCNGKGVIEC